MPARKVSTRSDNGIRRSQSIIVDDAALSESLQNDPTRRGVRGRREGSILEDIPEEQQPGSGPAVESKKSEPDLRAKKKNFSVLQQQRLVWEPQRADPFSRDGIPTLTDYKVQGLEQQDAEELKQHFPNIFDLEAVLVEMPRFMSASVEEGDEDEWKGRQQSESRESLSRPIRLGMVLSGGPAPGGHNVIAGVYDQIQEMSRESKLFGFKGGFDGFFMQEYITVTDDLMARFRNTGGFDMFWSGRGKVTPELMPKAKKIVEQLRLDGIIVVGGDGSNSNAALLAEYFASEGQTCAVVGVPKTIDGDLKNAAIECSFGFDTAVKTYSELVGNLTVDASSGQGVWHIVKIMGRTASHLVFETALQTRPNLVFVGEEVEHNKVSLDEIVTEIVTLMLKRAEQGKDYGIVLVPEGLIGFIPEMVKLTNELSVLMEDGGSEDDDLLHVIGSKLSTESEAVWKILPDDIKSQLLEERENTGYIQPAKIATDRLLKVLVEERLDTLRETEQSTFKPNIMAHYFGYEGRCAMPSNFDANYCYNLGLTAAFLASQGKNGYMAVVKDLEQNAQWWHPAGVPFTKLMMMIEMGGKRFPGIIRQLVDLNSESFRVFSEVRDKWKMGDYYRCPGPIQFDGPVSDVSNYVVCVPTADDLLAGSHPASQQFIAKGRAKVPKRIGCYSPLQRERLLNIPQLPDICKDLRARAVKKTQWMPKDPYLLRQIVQHFHMLSKNNQFVLQEMTVDLESTGPARTNMKVGIVFVSRPSPGMNNILWGLHERLKLSNSECFGFYGIDGLMNKDYIVVNDEDLKLYKNLGGLDLLGRCPDHKLLNDDNRDIVYGVCDELKLDGLVIVGSSLAMTEATLLTEHFLKLNQKRLADGDREVACSIIGVPATPSNNVLHELIETNVGFDTASKIYASLIGNVLTDAASMPKYWHFIRLMGRQPSNEVLECALQTHPNVVLISEEYGAGQKTLNDVVTDIADAVCERAEGPDGPRNFGAVLIPEGLWQHLPNIKLLQKELDDILAKADEEKEKEMALAELKSAPLDSSKKWAGRLSAWSAGVWGSLPTYIQHAFLTENPELRSTYIELESLLSEMVGVELERRKAAGNYKGVFQCVKHYFGYQGRSAMPSLFDSSLGFAHGHLAGLCIECDMTGYITSVRGLCNDISDWVLYAIPFNCLLCLIPVEQNGQLHPQLQRNRGAKIRTGEEPVIPNSEINLQSKSLRELKLMKESWTKDDLYTNPGPVQFYGSISLSEVLYKDHSDYAKLLKLVKKYTLMLSDSCSFGTDYEFLKVAYVNLNGLITLRFRGDNVRHALGQPAALGDYNNDEAEGIIKTSTSDARQRQADRDRGARSIAANSFRASAARNQSIQITDFMTRIH